MASSEPGPRQPIIALDFADPAAASALTRQLDPALCRLKVGKELFTRAGPSMVAECKRAGFDVFLDLKFHDIPHTVASACRAAADLGVWMVNVHAMGGSRMLVAARAALGDGVDRPLLTAVTVLTSMERADLDEVGWSDEPAALVMRLARLAGDAGCDGVVCSAREAADLRARQGRDFLLVTPGIRPQAAGPDDQRRTMTPGAALAAGADHLVVGRPVTRARDPGRALRDLVAEIAAAG